jgi:hypothetical protein
MSTIATNTTRSTRDHFEPEAMLDPQAQRKLRAHLEQIDYVAFAANREVISQALNYADISTFEKLAVATSQARARWVGEALAMSGASGAPTRAQTEQLSTLRQTYIELTEAYDALRRMVERGYLPYRAAT